MKHIQKMLMILCVLALAFVGLLTYAYAEEETAATPTDLDPAITEPNEEKPEETETDTEEETAVSEEPKEEAGDSIEIIITKSLQPGQSWDGTIKRKSPSILKLDFNYAQTVHILIEGHDVLAAVQKADRYTEDYPEQLTDPETDRLIIDLDAEAGSYLLTLRAGENSLLAKVSVSIMTQEEYEAWIVENQTEETEEQPEKPEEETEEESQEESEESNPTEQTKEEMGKPEEPEGEPEEVQEPEEAAEESETKDEEEPEQIPAVERSINVNLTWDVPDPMIGDTAHFKAILTGYEGLEYSMQWQYSLNRNDWIDITGETTDTLDVVATEENNFFYWRIIVYLEQGEEI